MRTVLVCVILLCLLIGCRHLVGTFTPTKTISYSENTMAKRANEFFWTQLHRGNYDSIPTILNQLNAAYLDNPNDLKITSHLGFVHIWNYSELQRQPRPSADILESFSLSQRFFAESYYLNPHDPRILGFLSAAKMAEGTVAHTKRMVIDGYFDGRKAMRQWPQFNKFTLGYTLSQNDRADKQFKDALRWQWETLDDCACTMYDRSTLNFQDLVDRIKNSKNPRITRACWNTWIAPHNWEGFCLNFGDMLVKSGDWKRGIDLYNAAKLAPAYNEWPYRKTLENRITNAEANVTAFNKPVQPGSIDFANQTVSMINSRFSCTGCHQMSPQELETAGYQEPTRNYYFLPAKQK